MPCVGFSACSRCSAMRSARAFTCSGLGFSPSARSACSSRLSSSATRPVLGCMSWSWMALVVLMRNLLAWSQSLGMSVSSSHGTAPRSFSDCSPATCSAFRSSLPRLKMFASLASREAARATSMICLAASNSSVPWLLHHSSRFLTSALAPMSFPRIAAVWSALSASSWRRASPSVAPVRLLAGSGLAWRWRSRPILAANSSPRRSNIRRVRGGWRSAGCCCA